MAPTEDGADEVARLAAQDRVPDVGAISSRVELVLGHGAECLPTAHGRVVDGRACASTHIARDVVAAVEADSGVHRAVLAVDLVGDEGDDLGGRREGLDDVVKAWGGDTWKGIGWLEER